MAIDRENVIAVVAEALEPLGYTHAMWEGGSAAFGRLDQWSDIDLYVIADDDSLNDVFIAVEEALQTLSPIELELRVQLPAAHHYAQSFYRLRDAGPFLLIDLAVIKVSSPEKFLQPEIHGENIFSFNKSRDAWWEPVDTDRLHRQLADRVDYLRRRTEMFIPFIDKELGRGKPIEALEIYRRVLLNTLVEILRIKHRPFHHDFGVGQLYHDLPPEVIREIEPFFFVRDEEDLSGKAMRAREMLLEVLSFLDLDDVRRSLKGS